MLNPRHQLSDSRQALSRSAIFECHEQSSLNPSIQQLSASWQNSASVLESIAARLADRHGALTDVHSVVVAGSYGRMEAAVNSDFDFFVISRQSCESEKQEQMMFDRVWAFIDNAALEPPDVNGIFRRVASSAQLCDVKALGSLDYPRHVFGLRIQLLTDAQALFGANALFDLQHRILCWYLQPAQSPFSYSPVQYLVSDLRRYFHSYSVWHQYRFDRTYNDSWLMRQLKMNHSRLASYVSLLVCLVKASDALATSEDGEFPPEELASQIVEELVLTPVERLIRHWPPDLGGQLDMFLAHYNKLLVMIHDEGLRERIIHSDPDCVRNRKKPSTVSQSELDQITRSSYEVRSQLTACLQSLAANTTPANAQLLAI